MPHIVVDKVYTNVLVTVPRDCWNFCFMGFISNTVIYFKIVYLTLKLLF